MIIVILFSGIIGIIIGIGIGLIIKKNQKDDLREKIGMLSNHFYCLGHYFYDWIKRQDELCPPNNVYRDLVEKTKTLLDEYNKIDVDK